MLSKIKQWANDRRKIQIAVERYDYYIEGSSIDRLGVHAKMIQHLIQHLNKTNKISGLWLCEDSMAVPVKVWAKDDVLLLRLAEDTAYTRYCARNYVSNINKVSSIDTLEESYLLARDEEPTLGWLGQNYVHVPDPALWNMNQLLVKETPNRWGDSNEELFFNYRSNGLLVQRLGDKKPCLYTHDELLYYYYLYY